MFTKGLALGFILAATVGPMWALCFRRTVASGALGLTLANPPTILAFAAVFAGLRGRLAPGLLRGINVASGISILAFALRQLCELWQLTQLFR